MTLGRKKNVKTRQYDTNSNESTSSRTHGNATTSRSTDGLVTPSNAPLNIPGYFYDHQKGKYFKLRKKASDQGQIYSVQETRHSQLERYQQEADIILSSQLHSRPSSRGIVHPFFYFQHRALENNASLCPFESMVTQGFKTRYVIPIYTSTFHSSGMARLRPSTTPVRQFAYQQALHLCLTTDMQQSLHLFHVHHSCHPTEPLLLQQLNAPLISQETATFHTVDWGPRKDKAVAIATQSGQTSTVHIMDFSPLIELHRIFADFPLPQSTMPLSSSLASRLQDLQLPKISFEFSKNIYSVSWNPFCTDKIAVGTGNHIEFLSLSHQHSRSPNAVSCHQSSPLSLAYLQSNILLAGNRKGDILVYDTRESHDKNNKSPSFSFHTSSSIHRIVPSQLNDQLFYASSLNGNIFMFDLRHTKSPIQSFVDPNSDLQRINFLDQFDFTMDDREQVIFTSRQKNSVDMHSVRTGELLQRIAYADKLIENQHYKRLLYLTELPKMTKVSEETVYQRETNHCNTSNDSIIVPGLLCLGDAGLSFIGYS